MSGYVCLGSYQASWICCYCGLEGHGSELLKLNTASALQPRSRSDAPRAPPTLPAGQSSRPKRPHVRAVWSEAIFHRRFLSRMPARWKAELLGQRGTLPLFLGKSLDAGNLIFREIHAFVKSMSWFLPCDMMFEEGKFTSHVTWSSRACRFGTVGTPGYV